MMDDVVRALLSIEARRLIPATAWLLGVLTALGVFLLRDDGGDVPRAARDLAVNHEIAANDLRTSATDALIGRVLRRALSEGQPVSPSSVQPPLKLATTQNSFAALVALTQAADEKQRITVGDAVVLLADSRQLGPLGRVVAMSCERSSCMATVAFSNASSVVINPADLVKAEIQRVR